VCVHGRKVGSRATVGVGKGRIAEPPEEFGVGGVSVHHVGRAREEKDQGKPKVWRVGRVGEEKELTPNETDYKRDGGLAVTGRGLQAA